MLLFLSEHFRVSFEEQGGYDTLSDFITHHGSTLNSAEDLRESGSSDFNELTRTKKESGTLVNLPELEAMEAQAFAQMPQLLKQKTVFRGASKASTASGNSGNFNLNMIILDAATCRFDNIYVMFSEK